MKSKRKKSTLILLIIGFGIPAYFVYELAGSDRLEMKRIMVYLHSGEIPKQTRALDSFEDYADDAFPIESPATLATLSESQKEIRHNLNLILEDVVRFCANKAHAQQVLIRCGWALQHFADHPDVRLMLVDLLRHKDKMVRYNSALALARRGDPAAKRVLQTMVANEVDRKVRYSAAVQLHQVAGEEDIEWVRTLIYTEKNPRIQDVLKLLLERLEESPHTDSTGEPDARR
jgi:HEAT repeat protein